MSSMKYDDDTCSTIISSLEKVSLALADVESALSTYYSNNSGLNSRIDARVEFKVYTLSLTMTPKVELP